MKAIKYLVMGVMLAGFSATANAQEAELNAALDGIKSKAPNAAELAKTAYKKNKKNPVALVAIGRAFYEQQDTAKAKEFALYADVASKHKSAEAFILLGDIAQVANDGGLASNQYQQAMLADPSNWNSYYKYALVNRKISPKGAEQALEKMRENCKDVNVDAIKGHIFYLANKLKDSYEAYSKAPIETISKDYLLEYAPVCFLTGKYEDGMKVVKRGLEIDPRNAKFNRFGMMFNAELQNYEEAEKYRHAYFNNSDSAKVTEIVNFYSGIINEGVGNTEKAIEYYNSTLKMTSDTSFIAPQQVYRKLINVHKTIKDFPNAIKYYEELTNLKEKKTFEDREELANLYIKYAENEEAEKKEELLKKAAEIFRNAGDEFEFQKVFARYQAASTLFSMDKDMKRGLANADYQAIIDLAGNKADRTDGESKMLKTAYNYMMFYNLNKGKTTIPLAKEFADKILELDPNFEPALKIKALK